MASWPRITKATRSRAGLIPWASRPSCSNTASRSEKSAVQTAVIVCPGGGYGFLAKDHEGDQIARWLNSLGIQAFVLEYRIAPRYHYPAPILDAQRAIRFVRAHRSEEH